MTTHTPTVRVLGTIRANDGQRADGLLNYLAVEIDDYLVIDGVQLRRTLDGRHVLAWPHRHDRKGTKHAVVRPAGDAARVALEDAVFAELGIER